MFRRIVVKNYDISIYKSETALENDAYVLLELESDMSASQAWKRHIFNSELNRI